MAGIVGVENTILIKINDLAKTNKKLAQNEALNSCADSYSTILVADIPKSIAALKLGDPKFAKDGDPKL